MNQIQIDFKNFFLETIAHHVTTSFTEKNPISNKMTYKVSELENYNFKYFIVDFELFSNQTELSNINNKEIISFSKNLYDNGFKFETLVQDVLSKQEKYKLLYPYINKFSYVLRFSKKYNQLECYLNSSNIRFIKKSFQKKGGSVVKSWTINNNLIMNRKKKLFKINANNKVLLYMNFTMPRYISLKNLNLYVSSVHSETYPIYKKLFQIHTQSNFQIPQKSVYISSKFLNKKNNFIEVIKSLCPNIPDDIIEDVNPISLIRMLIVLPKKSYDSFIEFTQKYFYSYKYTDYFKSLKDMTGYFNCFSNDENLFFVCLFVLSFKKIITLKNDKIYYPSFHLQKIVSLSEYINEVLINEQKIQIIFKKPQEFNYIINKYMIKNRLKNISFLSLKKQQQIILILKEKFTKVIYLNTQSQIYDYMLNKYFLYFLTKEFITMDFFEIQYKNNFFLIYFINNYKNYIVIPDKTKIVNSEIIKTSISEIQHFLDSSDLIKPKTNVLPVLPVPFVYQDNEDLPF